MPDRSAPPGGRPRDARRTSARMLASRAAQPIQIFLATEVAGGVLLLSAALVAVVWANSPWSGAYEAIVTAEAALRVGGAVLHVDVHHLVNDGLMTLFFLVVGLEITREVRTGELRDRRAAAVPAIAAIGGMAVPALFYLALNAGTAAGHGWGIPMATDIAFAVGVLTVAARSAPPGLRSFLLSLAIVDDIGAILVIALFYASGVDPLALLAAGAIVVLLVLHRRSRRWRMGIHLLLGAALWLAVAASGVHPTIAGVLVGVLTPTDTPGEESRSAPASPLDRLEARVHPWASYAIVPTFAFANAGVHLSASAFADALASPVTLGVVLGLVVGKTIGIPLAAWLAVRSGLGRLPDGVGWRDVVGVAAVAGIGFTVALFVADLAFADAVLTDRARVGILLASVVAGALGFAILRRRRAT